jgi:hypothetical protein
MCTLKIMTQCKITYLRDKDQAQLRKQLTIYAQWGVHVFRRVGAKITHTWSDNKVCELIAVECYKTHC